MKDVEILLRGFALLIDSVNYAPSMVKFLNQFSRKCKAQSAAQNTYLSNLFDSFLDACANLVNDAFLKNGRFNVALYESVFAATCEKAFAEKRCLKGVVSSERLKELERDSEFTAAMIEGTTQTQNVTTRLNRAKIIVGSL